MMTLTDFEQQIDPAILARGRDYFKSGCVASLLFDDERNLWIAEVAGSDDYEVEVALDESGRIIETSCDCPYDWGDFCKHQAAVFYALREEQPDKAKKSQPKQKLPELLDSLDKAVLVQLLLEYASNNREMKADLELRLSRSDDVLATARKRIKASIAQNMDRHFVDYRHTRYAIQGAEAVLDMTKDTVRYDALIRVQLCVLVLEEMCALIDNCDDSNGDVGGVIAAALEIAATIAAQNPSSAPIFDAILAAAHNKCYDGWSEWRLELLTALQPMCGNQNCREKLIAYLHELTPIVAKEKYSDYELRQLERMELELIQKFDGEAAADVYINAHLHNSDFRKLAIQAALKKQDQTCALALCLEGEAMHSEFVGLVRDFQKLRYDIYQQQGDVAAQKELALHFVKDGNFEYYRKLKKLYKPDEWPQILTSLLAHFEAAKYQRDIYVEVLIAEDLKEKILAYCRKAHAPIVKLYPHLLPEYFHEVSDLFSEYIYWCAEQASGRSAYHNVCETIQTYQKACGKAAAGFIINELKEKYPRRPAFLDELGKIGLG